MVDLLPRRGETLSDRRQQRGPDRRRADGHGGPCAHDSAAGDYSHQVDQFGIRCNGRQSHVATSSDAFEDGVPGEAYDTDEPWESIAPDSFDDAIREISCENMRPSPPSYDSVKAYIDAGRP